MLLNELSFHQNRREQLQEEKDRQLYQMEDDQVNDHVDEGYEEQDRHVAENVEVDQQEVANEN
jgi:hypothetical protein